MTAPAATALALILTATTAGAVEGLPLPSCAEVRVSGLVGGALADAFDRRYPRDLADPRRVERIALDAVARSGIPWAAGARTFARQMWAYRRGPG